MPTTRPRHAVTETDPVARALDDAAERWPEDRDNRSRLLVHLIEEGHQAIRSAAVQQGLDRRAAIERTHGALDGVFGKDYLKELREDWSE